MSDRFDVGRLNKLLADSAWPHGEIASLTTERIGEDFGLSAEIHRLHATTVTGESVSLVAKFEHLLGCRRALTAHRHAIPALGRAVPRLWASDIPSPTDCADDETGPGLLLIEDVIPAEQGDELVTASRERGLDLIRIVARLHEVPLPAADVVDDRWEPFVSPPDRWAESVDRVVRRSPDGLGPFRRRLLALRAQAIAAVDELSGAESAWIHVDPHLDNVLWRPDGSTVLLDWSNSRIGPPEVDVAVMLFTFGFGQIEVLTPGDLVDAYVAARSAPGVDPVTTGRRVRAALVLHTRSVLGWIGGPASEDFEGRKAELRDDSARRAARILEWLDR